MKGEVRKAILLESLGKTSFFYLKNLDQCIPLEENKDLEILYHIEINGINKMKFLSFLKSRSQPFIFESLNSWMVRLVLFSFKYHVISVIWLIVFCISFGSLPNFNVRTVWVWRLEIWNIHWVSCCFWIILYYMIFLRWLIFLSFPFLHFHLLCWNECQKSSFSWRVNKLDKFCYHVYHKRELPYVPLQLPSHMSKNECDCHGKIQNQCHLTSCFLN